MSEVQIFNNIVAKCRDESTLGLKFVDKANIDTLSEVHPDAVIATQRIEEEETEFPVAGNTSHSRAFDPEALSPFNTTNIDVDVSKTASTNVETIRTYITDAGDDISSRGGFRRFSEKEEEDEAVVTNSQSASEWKNRTSVSTNSILYNAETLAPGSLNASNCSKAESETLGRRSISLFYCAADVQKSPIKHVSESLPCTPTTIPLTDPNKIPITSKHSLFFGTMYLDRTTPPTEDVVQRTAIPVATITEIAATAVLQNDCAGNSAIPPTPVNAQPLGGTFDPTTTANTVGLHEQQVLACTYPTQTQTQNNSKEFREAQADNNSIPVKPLGPSSATLPPNTISMSETLNNALSILSVLPQNNDTPIRAPKSQQNSLKLNTTANSNQFTLVQAKDSPSPVYKIAPPQSMLSSEGSISSAGSASAFTTPSVSALSTNKAQDALEDNGASTSSTIKSRSSSICVDESYKLMHRDQRQALIDRREYFTNVLKASFMDPISVQVDACQEVHRAVSLHQLSGLNTRYPGYVFARDEDGNTLFHKASSLAGLEMSLEIFEELARQVDTSEFGNKVLPPVIQVDPCKVFPILKHSRSESSPLKSVSPEVFLTGWLYKRHGRNDFVKRFCTLSFEELKYYNSEVTANSAISSLKLTGSIFKMQRFDSGHVQFGSQSYFSIKPYERLKRKISLLERFGYTSKYSSSIDDQVEMEFVAESELLTQQWIYVLRVLTDHVAPLPTLTNQKCINIEARAIILNVVNNNGDTPLHTLAKSCNKEASFERKFYVLACIQWLFSNECNPFTKNNDGMTAFDIVARSIESQHEAMWIRVLTRLLVLGSHEGPCLLIPAPARIPGYSYLCFVLRDHKYLTTDANRSFLDLKYIKLAMYVLSDHGQTIEFAQRVDQPFLIQERQLFWGCTFHFSIPLENMPEGSYVLFQLRGWPNLPESTRAGSSREFIGEEGMIYVKYVYRINTTTMSSGTREIKFTDPPMTAGSVTGSSIEAPPSAASAALSNTVLSLFVNISRIAL